MEDFDDIRVQLGRLDQSITTLEARRAQLSSEVDALERRRLELDQLQTERQEIEREVAGLASRKEALAKTLASLDQRSAQLTETSRRLEEKVAELDRRRTELEATLAPLESQREELQRLERRQDTLQRETASVNDELGERRAEKERLERETAAARGKLVALGEEQKRLEAEMAGLQEEMREKLAVRGLGPETLALIQRLDESAARLGMTRDQIRVRIYALLERLEMDSSLEAELSENRRELERVQAELAARRAELATMHYQPSPMGADALQGRADRTAEEIRAFGDEAKLAIESLVREVRKEADYLFQDAMEIGARAAQVDADIRTREWFNDTLRYQPVRRPRDEIRDVATRALDAFDEWLKSRQLPAPQTEPVPAMQPARQRRQSATVDAPEPSAAPEPPRRRSTQAGTTDEE